MILDTNALSDLAERNPRLLEVLRPVDEVRLPIIALGEYSFGVAQSRHRAELETWLAALIRRSRVLYIDLETLPHYATIRGELKQAGTPIAANDLWIAALARQHDLPVASNDTDFDQVAGLERVKW